MPPIGGKFGKWKGQKLKTAKYIHNCMNCQFLGRFKQADLYACLKGGKAQSFVVRTGHRPETYISGITVKDVRLRKAQELWEARRKETTTET